MMQVENEVGVLGDSRDHSAAANHAFASPVPEQLTQYLQAHREQLYPDLRALWDVNGDKTTGTWAEVFGDTVRADEIFMAWHYARYVQAVTARGKAAYDIPMYVNTWLAGDDASPGQYPSGGPEPRVVDVWKAAGSALDIYAPDLYAENFVDWCRRYHRDGNPLFMPETRGAAPPDHPMSFTLSAKRPASASRPSPSTNPIPTRTARWPRALARSPASRRSCSRTRASATCTASSSTRIAPLSTSP